MLIMKKSQSLGETFGLPISLNEAVLEYHHLLIYLTMSCSENNIPVVIGQVSKVHVLEEFPGKVNELKDVRVTGERLSDIIHLPSQILLLGIRQEEDRLDAFPLGRDVHEAIVRRLPDAMEFSFNHHPSPNVDAPAHILFSAACGHMLWHDVETLIEWFSRQGFNWNEYRLLL